MEDRDLARLLSGRNEPSVLEKEADFAQVMAVIEREGRRKQRSWWWALGGAVAAACIALAVLPRGAPEDEFSARGGGDKGDFALACLGPDGSARCLAGGKVAFDLSAPPSLYFAAFARRADGSVLWYWPTPEGASPAVASFAGAQKYQSAILLDASHPAGQYTVFGVFSRTPLTRSALKRVLGDDLKGDGSVVVVQHTLTVSAQ